MSVNAGGPKVPQVTSFQVLWSTLVDSYHLRASQFPTLTCILIVTVLVYIAIPFLLAFHNTLFAKDERLIPETNVLPYIQSDV